VPSIHETDYVVDADLDRDDNVDSDDQGLRGDLRAAQPPGVFSDPDGPDSPVGFGGYLYDVETAHYHVRFRCDDPTTGRWIERDLLPYLEGLSLCQHAVGSPTA